MQFPTVEWGGYLEAIQLCEDYPPWENLIQHDPIFKILKEIEDCLYSKDAKLFTKLIDTITEIDANKLNSKVLDILKKRPEVLSEYPKETFQSYKILVVFFFEHYTSIGSLERFSHLGNLEIVDFILKNSKVKFTGKDIERITISIIRTGRFEMVKYFLENTSFCSSALTRMVLAAVNGENIPILELLVKKGVTLTKNQIFYLYSTSLQVFAFLMQNFVVMRENISTFITYFVSKDNADFVEYLAEKQGGEIPINLVITENAASVLMYLVENNKFVHTFTEEHLIEAIKVRAFKCLKILWNIVPEREQTIRYLANDQRSQNTQFLNTLMVNKMLEREHIVTLFNNAVQTKNYTYINYFMTFYLKKSVDENLVREFFLKIIK